MARMITVVQRRMRVAASDDRGMALMLVLMIMMLLSALMIGFMANIMADTRSSGVDRDETQAYAVAHAGMEKLTSDLAGLFATDYSPSGDQISTVAGKVPSLPPYTYTAPDGSSGYKVEFTAQKVGSVVPCPTGCEQITTPTTRNPLPNDPSTGTTIAAGPYQGFKGLVTRYNIMVTSLSPTSKAEVRMRRELQTVAVPVFQFGLFSESSLAFHSGSDFDFGGRVHTNGDLYLAGGNSTSNSLTLSDKVTAVGEVVRRYLDNGELSTTDYPGPVNMAKGAGVYRVLSATNNSGKGEGSVTGNTGPGKVANEPTWTGLSVGTYNGYIRSGTTGAKRLDLPLVSNGAFPIDLIRRPPPPVACPTTVLAENLCKPVVFGQRYYAQASLRILLSDTLADFTNLPLLDTATAPISLEAATLYGPAGQQAPLGLAGNLAPYRSVLNTPLIGGLIKIERLTLISSAPDVWAYRDITAEILNYGTTARNLSNGTANVPGSCASTGAASMQPDAIIRLQRVKDTPSTAGNGTYQNHCAVTTAGLPSAVVTDYWPLSLYDAREGLLRDESGANASRSLRLGGVMYYIELDVNNLAKWFKRTAPYAGGTGNLAKYDNGYIVYFSDRRNNRNAASAETGEYGNEDIINWTTANGTATGTLDAGEDVNATTAVGYTPVLDVYGALPNYLGVYNAAGTSLPPIPLAPPGALQAPLDATARPTTILTAANAAAASTNAHTVRANRPIFFRRALKLVNGEALRNQYNATTFQGLTITSENPVYVQGNYNATASVTPSETHIGAAVIADAITLLSNSWNDLNSFYDDPIDISKKTPSDTGYRFAAVTGKTLAFTQPTTWTPETNFGMDGGAHNLLRQLEYWGNGGGTDFTITYRGSIVSFYISRQAIGTFKCCNDTYSPGERNYTFDTDFLLPDKLPPGTPMFRDVNTLTFRQLLRPNQ